MVVTRSPLLSSRFILPHSTNTSTISSTTSTTSSSSTSSTRSRSKRSHVPLIKSKDLSIPIFQFQKAFEVETAHGGNLRSSLSPPLLVVVLDHPIPLDLSEIVGEEAGPHSYSAPYVRSLSTLLRRKFDTEEEQEAFNQRQKAAEAIEKSKAARHRQKLLHEKRDVLSEIGMLNGHLIALGVQAGSWVEVHSNTRMCLARVRGIKASDRPEQCLYVSPSIHFYLGLSDSNDDFVCLRKCTPETLPLSPFHSSHMDLEDIPCARTVHISLVRTPTSIRCKSEVQDRGLKIFFSGQPILKAGQIFGVPTQAQNYWLRGPTIAKEANGDSEDEEEDSDDEEEEEAGAETTGQFINYGVSLIYFQVVAADPPYAHFRVQADVTSLTVSDQVRSRVPYSLETFLAPISHTSSTLASSANSFISTSSHHAISLPEALVPGLQTSSEQLSSMLRPLLHLATSSLRLTSAILLLGPRRSGKRTLVSHTARRLGVHLIEKNAYELVGATDSVTADNIRNLFNSAKTFAPVLVHCRRFGAFKDKSDQKTEGTSLGATLSEILSRINQDTLQGCDPLPVLFVGSGENLEEIPASLKVLFTHTISVGEAPDLPLRNQLFQHYLKGIQLQDGLELTAKNLASRTAGLSPGEIDAMIADAGRVTLERGQKSVSHSSRPHQNSKKMQALRARVSQLMNFTERFSSEKKIEHEVYAENVSSSAGIRDFEEALNNLQLLSENATATAKIPDVKWSDVGGLQHVKREVMDTIELPLKKPELFASGLKQRKGILLYGPPGTGKTLIAKAVANECSLNFISVKGPELLNMYIGESEKNIREVFARARSCKPCVLFFDEIDSLAPARGQGSDGGGVMDRVVSQLLTELDGMNANNDVFIVAATNRPDLLDSALLRPGRLDRCVYLGVGDSPEQQLNILSALTRKFRLSPDTNLTKLANQIPLSYSGADLYALCSDAMLYALKRKIAQVDEWTHQLNLGAKETVSAREVLSVLDDSELEIIVTMDDFLSAQSQLTPSLSADELAHYRTLQQQFSSRAIK